MLSGNAICAPIIVPCRNARMAPLALEFSMVASRSRQICRDVVARPWRRRRHCRPDSLEPPGTAPSARVGDVGGHDGTVVTRTIVAWLVLAASVGTARAESSLGEMAANVNQLVEPARRTELRLDAGGVTSIPRRGSRFEVTLEIAPRPDYWYGIGVGSGSMVATSESLSTDSNGNPHVSMVSTTSDSGVSLSARIFKRIGPLVFSGGVLDDRPAVAVELRAWNDRLRFEVVNQAPGPWQITARPSVRLGGSLQWQWFYFQAGVQDIADGSLRAGYAGLGMRWKDNDLRDLLPWVAAR
jgi:hypothetical protein